MDAFVVPVITVFGVIVGVLLFGAVMLSMFGGEVVGSVRAIRSGIFGSRGNARLTVRRVGKGASATAKLQATMFGAYRGIALSRAHATQCAELLERCASDGRVGDGAGGLKAGGIEIAPDFDVEEGRTVAIVLPGDSESPDIRILLTPSQAKSVAGWLRKALGTAKKQGPREAALQVRSAESGNPIGFPPPAD